MTIQEIQQHVESLLLTARENATPPNYDLAPYRPCPVCPGVMREEGETVKCWTCGSSLRSAAGGVR